MFGPENINDSIDFTTSTSMSTGFNYMWSYGCGIVSFKGCSGVSSTSLFSTEYLQTTFTMLFGSYFRDWYSEDNLLRAAIAQGQTLTSAWAGRPHWQFHHMALGANIGVSTKITQKNKGQYFSSIYNNFYERKVHIALMGDPTLRMHYISPPENLITTKINKEVVLNWTSSQETVLGYNVYRILAGENSYTKLNNSLITGTNYSDNTILFNNGITYIVKAVNLKTTASGSYFNQSIGSSSTTSILLGLNELEAPSINIYIYPNPNMGFFNIELGNFVSKDISMKIYNLNGTSIFEDIIYTSNYRMNFNKFPKGVYSVKLTRTSSDFILKKNN
ncbi:T9SS type A sorting domain-containing protein [Vicingaceae bacterium]|nr:T9SS type A sorting domain-containing protein [Vicingaceae bacterium]